MNDNYHTHLYSESSESALLVPVEEPVYDEVSADIDGYMVLNKCFDAALKRDPRVIAFGEDVGKLGEVMKQSPAKDIEQNLKAGVTSMLGKLDMVSREEFDVQTEVLARTRAKLAQLEARLTELEKQQSQDA